MHKNTLGTFYDGFGEIGFRRFFDSEKNPGSGNFDPPPPAPSPPHLDSTMSTRLVQPKDHREVMRKRVSEAGGRIKTLSACYLKIDFQKFCDPKKCRDRDFCVLPFLGLANIMHWLVSKGAKM